MYIYIYIHTLHLTYVISTLNGYCGSDSRPREWHSPPLCKDTGVVRHAKSEIQ